MKANATRFLSFLHKANQFIIPIYQRNYSWDEKQCQQLWDDIIRVGSNDSIGVHFIGSIVYIQGGHSSVTSEAPLLVIDGQQRLTTLNILLEAVARVTGETEPVEGFSAVKVRHHYLTNPLETDERHFKLLLSDVDRDSLKAIIKGTDLPKNHSIRIRENFDFFVEKIADNSGNLREICRGIAKLMIVDIALEREQDNPQLIFESMNSTGKALSEADLIRNFILMGLEPKLQSDLYLDYWRPMELDFGQEAYGDQFDDFMRHYLTIKMGDIPKLSEVYEAFKEYAANYFASKGTVRELVSDIRRYSKYFVAMKLGSESNQKLKRPFQDLFVDMGYEVSMPFLMAVYADYDENTIGENDFLEIIRLVESYVFRRSVCQIPTNSMNKTFAEFPKNIEKSDYINSIRRHFAKLPSYRRFPGDEEFEAAFATKDVYNYNLRKYLLAKLENYGKKETITPDNYSIEHVMPQNPNLSKEWKMELGENWRAIQERYLHTIGNLTLTGYNPEYSDKSFTEKKTMSKGFDSSPLTLNASIASETKWDEIAILNRGKLLARKAVEIWPFIKISEDELQKVRASSPKLVESSTFSVNDNEYLTRPHVRELFEALRKEVLSLDEQVSETFLKHWIAYKWDTNFVDVVPKAKGLRLSINMKYKEINDPQGMTEDISGKGRWGNGEVSVHFRNMGDLPYIMNLVKQSLEKQQFQE
jgi:uncharacterized protein with ParB-like and HNH nuclease domain/predicted transport protein